MAFCIERIIYCHFLISGVLLCFTVCPNGHPCTVGEVGSCNLIPDLHSELEFVFFLIKIKT